MLDVLMTWPVVAAALVGAALAYVYTMSGLFVLSALDGPKYGAALHRIMGKGAVFVFLVLPAWPWVALQVVTLHKRIFAE